MGSCDQARETEETGEDLRGKAMLKNMTVGKRLAMGFGIILAVLAVTILASFTGMGKTVGNAKEVIYGNQLDQVMAQKEIDHLNWASQVSALLTDENVTQLAVQTDDHECGFGKWLYSDARREAEQRVPSLVQILGDIEGPHAALHRSAAEIDNHFEQADADLPGLIAVRMVDHLKWADTIRDTFLAKQTELTVQTDPHQCALGQWLDTPQAKQVYAHADAELKQAWDAMLLTHRQLHESAIGISQQIGNGEQGYAEAERIFNEATLPALHGTLNHLGTMKQAADHALNGMKQANEVYAHQTVPSLEETRSLLHKARETIHEHILTEDAMLAAATATKRNVGVLGIIGAIAGIGLAVLITRSIVGTLKGIIDGLKEGSEQVAAASGQVSAASQSLAEGATEQAAGLEETSSSLEEMSSMTSRNADNAQQASTLATEARNAADSGGESMRRMNDAIREIQRSSDDTAKIIKVIDEIAFQTNLLALNAAVEAARAGEAGKGFAVVAEEVRNLAMRSADAAKNTSHMIEESVKNAQNGVDIAEDVGRALEAIVQSVGKTTDLVSEIAAASQEQAQGISQVNTAVSQMDKVTQQNAANAEESASASEELTAQAESMNDLVAQLVTLVGGSTSARKRVSSRGGRRRSKESDLKPSDVAWHHIAADNRAHEASPSRHVAAALADDQTDLQDFNA